MGFQFKVSASIATEGLFDIFKKKDVETDQYKDLARLAQDMNKISSETYAAVLREPIRIWYAAGGPHLLYYFTTVHFQMQKILQTDVKPMIMKYMSVTADDMMKYEQAQDDYERMVGHSIRWDDPEFQKYYNALKVTRLEKQAEIISKKVCGTTQYKNVWLTRRTKSRSNSKSTFGDLGFTEQSLAKIIPVLDKCLNNTDGYYASDVYPDYSSGSEGINKVYKHLKQLNYNYDSDSIPAFNGLDGICCEAQVAAEHMYKDGVLVGNKLVASVRRNQPELFQAKR